MKAPRTLTFVTRADCHLCDDTAPIVAKHARREGFTLVVIDVDTDAALVELYGERVPVVLDESGRVLVEGLLTGPSVKRALETARLHE